MVRAGELLLNGMRAVVHFLLPGGAPVWSAVSSLTESAPADSVVAWVAGPLAQAGGTVEGARGRQHAVQPV
jgi:hypothetical protein